MVHALQSYQLGINRAHVVHIITHPITDTVLGEATCRKRSPDSSEGRCCWCTMLNPIPPLLLLSPLALRVIAAAEEIEGRLVAPLAAACLPDIMELQYGVSESTDSRGSNARMRSGPNSPSNTDEAFVATSRDIVLRVLFLFQLRFSRNRTLRVATTTLARVYCTQPTT